MATDQPRERPKLIISSLDSWRLFRLLDELPAGSFAGLDELVYELSRGRVVGPPDIPPNVVTMNCVLRITVLAPDYREMDVTLVYPQDADEAANRISIFTSLGSSLIGLSEGDEIDWPAPDGGFTTVRVDKILYQPEREGHLQV